MRFTQSAPWLVLPALMIAGAAPSPPPGERLRQHDAQQQQQAQQQLPWPIQLGARVEQVDQAFPVIDRAVLVPDPATYLDELAKWSPRGRWPVLIEDDQYAPMFLRRFAPAQLIRRESVGALAKDKAALRRAIEEVVVRTWDGNPQTQSIRETFAARQFFPCGVVIASTDDPAWTAAVALAAGRGQPIGWLDDQHGQSATVLSGEQADRLIDSITSLVEQAGYPAGKLGDAIDAITLCRLLGGRVNVARGGQPNIMATTDIIGRSADNSRWAFTGWIFGSEVRSAYVAMCSLFLPRENVWLYNTYPDSQGWGAYGITDAARALQDKGYTVKSFDGESASERAWTNMLPGGVTADVFAMNTKGNADFFDMSRGQLHPDDVPILNTPVALHLIHSWSMTEPNNPVTLGGQWIVHGAYAYVGSVDEPGLGAFLPPGELAKRWSNHVPFLVAARHWEGPVWKVNTFGDPLMLARAPGNPPPRPRVSQPADYGQDLGELVKEQMRRAPDDAEGKAYGEAIRTLELLGRDDVAAQMWKHARQAGRPVHAARPALGPLFRRRDLDEFLAAWDDLGTRDAQATDMLWHLLTPRLNTGLDQDTLAKLEMSIRRPHSSFDLARLAPELTSAFGQARTRALIHRELENATRTDTRQRLNELMKRY